MTMQANIEENSITSIDLSFRTAAEKSRDAMRNLSQGERLKIYKEWDAEFKKRYAEIYPQFKLIEHKSDYAKLDAMIVDEDGKIVAVCEIKCRNCTFDEFKKWSSEGTEWVIDKSKIEAGVKSADEQITLFCAFAYCVVDKTVVRLDIYKRYVNKLTGKPEPKGQTLAPYTITWRETSKGSQGGREYDNVAILNIENAKVFRLDGGDNEAH